MYNDKILINVVRETNNQNVSYTMRIYYSNDCKNFYCVDDVIPVPYMHYRDVDFTVALDNLKNFARS